MHKAVYFDYQKVAKETGVPDGVVAEIENDVKREFPNDRMMQELHILRALKSRYWEKEKS